MSSEVVDAEDPTTTGCGVQRNHSSQPILFDSAYRAISSQTHSSNVSCTYDSSVRKYCTVMRRLADSSTPKRVARQMRFMVRREVALHTSCKFLDQPDSANQSTQSDVGTNPDSKGAVLTDSAALRKSVQSLLLPCHIYPPTPKPATSGTSAPTANSYRVSTSGIG